MAQGYFATPEDMQRHMEQAEAESHERRQRFFSFLENMSPKELGTLYEILGVTAHLEDPQQYLNFLLGQISSIQKIKHGACVCGEDHDSEALNTAKEELHNERAVLSANEHEAAMKEYGLVVFNGEIRCVHCGLRFKSLEDRMLRPPGMDGCHGCQLKSGHG